MSAIGVDAQHSRTAVMLGETGGGPAARLTAVGDGFRRLVPNATDAAGHWGSAAVPVAGPAAGTPAELLRWRTEPWTGEFLGGLRERLFAYLGQVPPDPGHGYEMCVAVPPERGADDVIRDFADAGMPRIEPVNPTDALLCRWLTEPSSASGQEWDRSVVTVVVCGESWSAASTYRVEFAPLRSVERVVGSARTTACGGGACAGEFARVLLGRLTGGVPAGRVLPLLDGVLEVAPQFEVTDDIQPVTWLGPLADELRHPLRLTPAELFRWPAATVLGDALRDLARDSLAPAGRADAVVVGGVGAIWPFVDDVLRAYGPVWRGRSPELDVAAGAALFPRFRRWFTDGGRGHFAPRPAAEPVAPPPPASLDEPVADDLPPWERTG